MLADVAGDDRLAAGRLVQRLDQELRLDLRVGAVLVAQRVLLAPALDPCPPALQARRIGPQRAVLDRELAEHVLGVADDRDVRGHVLGDLRRVDVDVDELRARRELRELAGDAIVEARPDRADQVGLVHRVVRGARAVHPEHPEPLGIGLTSDPILAAKARGKRAEAHQRAGHREAVAEGELDQLGGGFGVDDPAAGVDHRALRRRERLGGLADLLLVALERRLVAGQAHVGHRLVLDLRAREILGDVDQHGAGPPAASQVEGLVDRARDLHAGAGS